MLSTCTNDFCGSTGSRNQDYIPMHCGPFWNRAQHACWWIRCVTYPSPSSTPSTCQTYVMGSLSLCLCMNWFSRGFGNWLIWAICVCVALGTGSVCKFSTLPTTWLTLHFQSVSACRSLGICTRVRYSRHVVHSFCARAHSVSFTRPSWEWRILL